MLISQKYTPWIPAASAGPEALVPVTLSPSIQTPAKHQAQAPVTGSQVYLHSLASSRQLCWLFASSRPVSCSALCQSRSSRGSRPGPLCPVLWFSVYLSAPWTSLPRSPVLSKDILPPDTLPRKRHSASFLWPVTGPVINLLFPCLSCLFSIRQ